MKKLLFFMGVMILVSGCAVYPGYYGYSDSYDYGYPYGYAGPNASFYYSHSSGDRGHYYGKHGFHYGRHGGWRR
jgi:hypothetical protein